MAVYKIAACAEGQYCGSGKAWAAVKDGRVVGLRYMNGSEPVDRSKWPAWVRAVNTLNDGLDRQNLPTYHSTRSLSRLAQALASCPDTPKPLRRANYRPSELVRKAREYIAAADAENFANYREKCRAELEQIGEVFSGMCSCWQFVVK